jgi:hypothetical protein
LAIVFTKAGNYNGKTFQHLGSPVFSRKDQPVVALLAGGTICQANRTAATAGATSRQFRESQHLICTVEVHERNSLMKPNQAASEKKKSDLVVPIMVDSAGAEIMRVLRRQRKAQFVTEC